MSFSRLEIFFFYNYVSFQFTIGFKIAVIAQSELPPHSLCLALVPLASVLLAVPFRAIYNAIIFIRDAKTK